MAAAAVETQHFPVVLQSLGAQGYIPLQVLGPRLLVQDTLHFGKFVREYSCTGGSLETKGVE
jgi:hypothetical protein